MPALGFFVKKKSIKNNLLSLALPSVICKLSLTVFCNATHPIFVDLGLLFFHELYAGIFLLHCCLNFAPAGGLIKLLSLFGYGFVALPHMINVFLNSLINFFPLSFFFPVSLA